MTLRVRAVSEEERKTLGRMARSHSLGAGLVRRAQTLGKRGPAATGVGG